MLSPLDDYPFHQIAEPMRFVATSDRNFFDRYYFNMHPKSGETFCVFGFGQYPNLAVQDAFVLVRRGTSHRVLRGSRELGDRGDISVGPIRIEIIEGLQKLRFRVAPNEHGIEMDVVWQGAIPAFLEPRQYIRRHGRVLFDTMRFAQTGRWDGYLAVDGERIDINHWIGSRDRCWGVRPVGEAEPLGIHAKNYAPSILGMWNYFPMQFDDFSVLYICNEENGGHRALEEGVRVWNDPAREPDWLGSPQHEHEFFEGTQLIKRSTLHFADSGTVIHCRPKFHSHIMVGTGYGIEADWKHGMYHGELAVQGLSLDTETDKQRMWGLVEATADFEFVQQGTTARGHGMMESMFIGPFAKYGFA